MAERELKVPQITAGFWAVKLLTTAFGEAASDFLAQHGVVVLNGALVALATAVFAVLQLRHPRYSPWRYWGLAALIATFGTMVADVLHVALGAPYLFTTIGFAVVLALVLVLWRRTQGTLDIHTVDGGAREWFYWATVAATFALGTAAGDFTADALGLGYWGSTALFAAIILIPWLGRRWLGFGGVFAFWFAYIVTRPLGASVADLADRPVADGGLGVPTGWVALVLGIVMIAGFTGLSLRHAQAQRAMTAFASRRNAGAATSTPSR